MKRIGERVGIRHTTTYAQGVIYIYRLLSTGADYRVFSCLRPSASISEGELGNTPDANAFFRIAALHKSDSILGLWSAAKLGRGEMQFPWRRLLKHMSST